MDSTRSLCPRELMVSGREVERGQLRYWVAESVMGGVEIFVVLVIIGYSGSEEVWKFIFLKLCMGVYGRMAWVMGLQLFPCLGSLVLILPPPFESALSIFCHSGSTEVADTILTIF